MTFTIEEERQIFKFFRQQNCCIRCCFRFIGWRTLECYQDPLQFIKRIQTEVEKHNYDSETFICALTIPPCLNLRERLLHMKCGIEFNLTEAKLVNLKVRTQNIKDTWKWIITPKIEQAIKKKLDLTTPSTFLIEIILTYEYNEKECNALLSTDTGENHLTNKRKRQYNDNRFSRKNIDTIMANITDTEFAQCFKTLSLDTTACVTMENIVCSHSSIFVGGRYSKLSRELSQTPWFINGEKKMETSVQDILCNPIVEVVRAESIKFLSSGREDVDVRNIYSGRPFAIELINPHMTKLTEKVLSDLVEKINQSSQQVQVTSKLKILSRLDLKKLKEGENVKTKFYRALCICRNMSKDMLPLAQLNNLKQIKIIQKTPVRVLHRRPLAPRTRLIHEMRARWAKPYELKKLLNTASEDPNTFFVLDIKTQAGTYVKEFVHGDFGRTKPSLCDILKTEVDIVALDVTGINLNWP
ncbi:pseudouridine synthase 10 isoform X2 [Calliopsis andreniformis]|uniref:pseudouridine synthase 10 isoform X2 n=1 Tax=Calliopsis andreniformis TaxID=337506 RepID=UPI003FCD4F88